MQNEIKKFEVGKTYKMESDSDGMIYKHAYKCVKRSALFVTVQDVSNKEIIRKKVELNCEKTRECLNVWGYELLFA